MSQPHTHHIGSIELTTYDDGRFLLPSEYFPNVPTSASQGPQTEIGANLWMIKSGDRRILVDTGSAEALKAMFPETGLAWLALQETQPTDVFLTHMHADHLGGFADASAFADIPVHVSEAEWAYWTNPELPNLVPEGSRPMIEMIQMVAKGIAERVVLHKTGDEIAPGVTLVDLPGHTAGHSGLRLSDGDQDALIIGDAVISEAFQFANPEVAYAMDGDAEMAVKTRRALLSETAESGALIAATHFAFPGQGRVAKDGEAFAFSPL